MAAEEVMFSVTLEDVTIGAALHTLLAIEGTAGRLFPDRATDPEQNRAYNALSKIVLPLRAAMDEAVAGERVAGA